MRPYKFFLLLLVVLIVLPVVVSKYPYNQATISNEAILDSKPVAFATTSSSTSNSNALLDEHSILFYFTHPEEAYKPITLQAVGKQLASHQASNIKSLNTQIEEYFALNGMDATSLDVDVANQIKLQGLQYKDSYKVIRPYIKQALEKKYYDLIIDFHRDAAGKKATTINLDGVSYANIAFVVGSKHAAYEGNYAYAQALEQELVKIVPGISRGILKKGD